METIVLDAVVCKYLPEHLSMEMVRVAVRKLCADPTNKRLLPLYLAKEPLERYVEALDLSHLPVADQQQIVSRHKKRLYVRLKRLGAKLDGS